jgi:hypothetical protein
MTSQQIAKVMQIDQDARAEHVEEMKKIDSIRISPDIRRY